jgi:hypothetical protein
MSGWTRSIALAFPNGAPLNGFDDQWFREKTPGGNLEGLFDLVAGGFSPG